MTTTTIELPETVAAAQARMAELERLYKRAGRLGDEASMAEMRLEWRTLRDRVPELRSRERDAARARAAELGQARRVEMVALAKRGAAALGEFHSIAVEMRALWEGADDARRLGEAVDGDLFAAVYRSALGATPPAVTWIPWIAELAKDGVIDVPASIAADPMARPALQRVGVEVKAPKRVRR